jgi:hypothetical protein
MSKWDAAFDRWSLFIQKHALIIAIVLAALTPPRVYFSL